MTKEILYDTDLRNISDFLGMLAGADSDKNISRYREILYRMADSMLSDDGIVVTDDYFDRQHGV